MSGRLIGRTAVVMGSGEPSVGRASAVALAAEGAHVIAVDPSEEANQETSRLIENTGGAVTPIVSSISDEAELTALADRCRASFERVDVLVNCHLEAQLRSIEVSTAADWIQAFNGNVVGPALAAKVFLPLMKMSSEGSIIHIGSVDGTLGNPHIPTYSVSKGALTALTHVMAEEFAKYEIRVNCIARAAIDDGRTPVMENLLAVTPLRRAAQTTEIGKTVVFFASQDSSYCTGAILTVDGGRTAITPGTTLPR